MMNRQRYHENPGLSGALALPFSRRRVMTSFLAGAAGIGLAVIGPSEEATGRSPALAAAGQIADLLPSWNDGPAKDAIVSFVERVTDPGSDAYVEPADRIAAFDNDGTLWCEMPLPQLEFLQHYAREQAEAHSELRTIQPYKAIWEGDADFFGALIEAVYSGDMATVNAFMEIIMEPFAGMPPAEYDALVQTFFETAQHPELQVPYRQLIYQPMVELVGMLQANAFDVYICTGGDRDFVRGISEDFYGISRANVIGSAVELDYQTTDGGLALVRRAAVDQPFTDGPGKPVRIEMQIGRQPILVGGNSDGDVAMLGYAQQQHSQFLGLLVHHDDADREFAYDQGAETALQVAADHDWIVASMKDDFKEVFPVIDG
jgi:phosphoserine phosphatase